MPAVVASALCKQGGLKAHVIEDTISYSYSYMFVQEESTFKSQTEMRSFILY